jgi:hypothetical protein
VIGKRDPIQRARDTGLIEQHPGRRREKYVGIGLSVEKWMGPDGIARHNGHATRAVDNGDDEAAAQTRQGRFTPALVRLQDEVSSRAIWSVKIVWTRSGFATEEEAMEETAKISTLGPSRTDGRYAAWFRERER